MSATPPGSASPSTKTSCAGTPSSPEVTMTFAPNRKALVTGGASGFGLELARRLRASGADVARVDLAEDRLDAAAKELGASTIGLAADVRSPEGLQRAVRTGVEVSGGLDTVVVSAGVIHIKPLEEVSETDWDLTLDVNLKGAFLMGQGGG